MPLFEIRFDKPTHHPSFIEASDIDEAKRIAVEKASSGSQRNYRIEDIALCVKTDKVLREEVIPQYTSTPGNGIHVDLRHLDGHIDLIKDYGEFHEQPEFQRAHVWTEEQQIAYMEHLFRGGKSGLDIYMNCAGWDYDNDRAHPTVVVDGLQRLTAIKKFMDNELVIFGKYTRSSFQYIDLHVVIYKNDLKTEKEVLQWYLEMNSGGTPHTDEELEKVRNMLVETQND